METAYLTTSTRGGRSPARLWRKRTTALLLTGAVGIGVALTLAGCGSGSPNSGVAHIGSTTAAASSGPAGSDSAAPTVDSSQLEKYAQCIRAHGVPNFYPGGNGLLRAGRSGGPDLNSPQFKGAQQACRSLAPKMTASPAQVAQLQAQALRYSQCMRSHGVPNFPDPQFHGNTARLTLPRGLDPNSPQFKSATQACRSSAPKGPKVQP